MKLLTAIAGCIPLTGLASAKACFAAGGIECIYKGHYANGDEWRCAKAISEVYDKDCPKKYGPPGKEAGYDHLACLDVSTYNSRHKCRDGFDNHP
ncbi:hypothetical protein M3J07_011106 [Ascochyta lentis]